MEKINTQGLKCDFGKHKGELYTRIPVGYLLWMVNIKHSRQDIAQAELDRRGTVLPDIDISGHAIDRLGQKCYGIMKENKVLNYGMHKWLVEKALQAMDEGEKLEEDKFLFMGIKWVFDMSGCWPVLKTVMRKEK